MAPPQTWRDPNRGARSWVLRRAIRVHSCFTRLPETAPPRRSRTDATSGAVRGGGSVRIDPLRSCLVGERKKREKEKVWAKHPPLSRPLRTSVLLFFVSLSPSLPLSLSPSPSLSLSRCLSKIGRILVSLNNVNFRQHQKSLWTKTVILLCMMCASGTNSRGGTSRTCLFRLRVPKFRLLDIQ